MSDTSRERQQAFGAALGYELREGEQPSELAARIEEDFRLARAESYQQGREDAARAIEGSSYMSSLGWGNLVRGEAAALARGGEVEGDPST